MLDLLVRQDHVVLVVSQDFPDNRDNQDNQVFLDQPVQLDRAVEGRVLWVRQARRVLPVPQDKQDPKVYKVRQDQQVPKDKQVLKDKQDPKVYKVRQDQQDHKLPDLKVQRDRQVPKAYKEPQDQ